MNLQIQLSVIKNQRSHSSGLLKLSLLSTLCFNLAAVFPIAPALASQTEGIEHSTEFSADTINTHAVDIPTTIKTIPAIASYDPLSSVNGEESTVSDGLDRVTNVNQLRDVAPTDWAFEALQSLVERYGCIVGYPDRTYRGDRVLTRWEFAAGLNACMNVMERLLQESVAVLKEDIDKLKRLAQEFETELAALGARVDNLESRVAFLEEHQFSTTTKLSGNAIFSLADLFGADSSKNQTVFQERVNLNLITSFTGRDQLLLALYAGNVPFFPIGGFTLPTTTAGGIPVNSSEGALSSTFAANTGNSLTLYGAAYVFPVGQQAQVFILGASTGIASMVPKLNPHLDDNASGTGAISQFGQHNAIYTLGATGGGAGAGVNFQLSPQFLLTGAYAADEASNPEPGGGLFNGGYSAFGQITWTPSSKFSLAATYTNTYFTSGRFGFNYDGLPLEGTAVANTLAGQTRLAPGPFFNPSPVMTNSYGVQASYKLSPGFTISGWFGATYARLIGEGDGTILNYALTFAFPDLGKEGNLLGLVVGAEPYLTRFEGGTPQSFQTDIPLHLEAFYRYQVTDNISITPGFIVLTAPNQDASNGVDAISTVRTTFTF